MNKDALQRLRTMCSDRFLLSCFLLVLNVCGGVQESHCSSARRGGDLGEFGPGKMQPAFEQATFALAVGELSGPVFSDSGVHIILRTA